MAKKVMKKYQAGGGTTQPAVRPGNTVKPPRSIRGPKQSPSDMRQPFPKPAVRPGNTVKPPKSVRKAGPSTPANSMMRKGGSMRGKSC